MHVLVTSGNIICPQKQDKNMYFKVGTNFVAWSLSNAKPLAYPWLWHLCLYGNVIETLWDNFQFINYDGRYNFNPFHFLVHVLQKEKLNEPSILTFICFYKINTPKRGLKETLLVGHALLLKHQICNWYETMSNLNHGHSYLPLICRLHMIISFNIILKDWGIYLYPIKKFSHPPPHFQIHLFTSLNLEQVQT